MGYEGGRLSYEDEFPGWIGVISWWEMNRGGSMGDKDRCREYCHESVLFKLKIREDLAGQPYKVKLTKNRVTLSRDPRTLPVIVVLVRRFLSVERARVRDTITKTLMFSVATSPATMEKQKEGSEVVRGGGGGGGSQTRAGDGGGRGGGRDYSSGGGGDGGGAIPWPRLSSLSLITRERGKIPDGAYTTAER
ncbi:hypothetical protein V1478_003034 [Vespula squamosa]|uniref:Uncharacterized protein n=1 Tax=Vespula squamosa TaxID=30214 RepID=A0ABD2BRJ0_VESSQ